MKIGMMGSSTQADEQFHNTNTLMKQVPAYDNPFEKVTRVGKFF
jgi:hypothetical protein